ncbi:MAG: restriction endonuclease [Azonexus sp.]|jgi:DNA modification methylase|nr:restriction endonuclease [Azonexus sp.]
MNSLYFGDNLDVLREHLQDESVDLIYLDPPFNSARDYNVLFLSPQGETSEAQITAFEDTWHWGEQAEREFAEIVHSGNTAVAEMMRALRDFLNENDVMAYLTMMANRLLELHRVLKPTGSLYLHCDPTASHYLKIILDGVFGKENYRNEIIWQRTNAHNFKSKQFHRVHDVVFFYAKTGNYTHNQLYGDFSPQQLARYQRDARTGRMFTGQDLTIIGGDLASWRGTTPKAPRGWGMSLAEREKLWAADMILKRQDGSPRLDGRKVWLDEKAGVPITDLWIDVERIGNTSKERLGYPTQKPLALLERIITASSNAGDVILDPFCGCGTAVHAAQKLGRRWIGIDITHLAVSLIEKRLKDAFPGIAFAVEGTPKDLEGARDLAGRDKYQFQWWACSLVNAQPYQGKKKGADGGIDGLIYFQDEARKHKKIVVSVKGGGNVNVAQVRDLAHVIEREKAEIGLFVTLAEPTRPMLTEAVKAGYYTSPASGKAFPKLQILSVGGLLDGSERALYPDLSQGATTFKKARVEEKPVDQKKLF